MLASVASSASTVSATFEARFLAILPRSRAVSRLRWRGDGEKKTNPTMSAPASNATSSVSRVDRPQILTIRDISGTPFGNRDRAQKAPRAWGRVLQRRALLVSPGSPISALRRSGQALRIRPQGHCGAGTQIGQLCPRLARIGLVLALVAPPAGPPKPGPRGL